MLPWGHPPETECHILAGGGGWGVNSFCLEGFEPGSGEKERGVGGLAPAVAGRDSNQQHLNRKASVRQPSPVCGVAPCCWPSHPNHCHEGSEGYQTQNVWATAGRRVLRPDAKGLGCPKGRDALQGMPCTRGAWCSVVSLGNCASPRDRPVPQGTGVRGWYQGRQSPPNPQIVRVHYVRSRSSAITRDVATQTLGAHRAPSSIQTSFASPSCTQLVMTWMALILAPRSPLGHPSLQRNKVLRTRDEGWRPPCPCLQPEPSGPYAVWMCVRVRTRARAVFTAL